MSADIRHGDSLEVLAAMADNSVDAIVTDPPYGLGFMGKAWDDLPPGLPWAQECLRVLKPGGHMLAFGGTRTWHRLACAVEDAGFEMRDSIAWLYGSGFPKSLDVGKAIDKANGRKFEDRYVLAQEIKAAREAAGFSHADVNSWFGYTSGSQHWESQTLGGARVPSMADFAVLRARLPLSDQHYALVERVEAEREVVGHRTRKATGRMAQGEGGYAFGESFADTAPATDAARQWQGWGTALKPGYEPVVHARKPLNAVPLDGEVVRLHHLIGALLWLSLSPAKRAELTSRSSRIEPRGGVCASALVLAEVATSHGESDETDTFNSPALASTSWNIARSWNAILAALSDQTITSTTSMRSSTTTGLRILNSLLAPLTSQTIMPRCGCLTDGLQSSASGADLRSAAEWANWLHTLSASALAAATSSITAAVESTLAVLAVESSSAGEAASSARTPATGSAAASPSTAFEPVVVARKPLVGTVAQNVLAYGTGAINVDACRIKGAPRVTHADGSRSTGSGDGWGMAAYEATVPAGRWPANVVLDEDQAAALDQQSGTLTAGNQPKVRNADANRTAYGIFEGQAGLVEQRMDSGGASRFFYVAKAPKSERPVVDGIAHPTVKPLGLMRWLVRLVTPPGGTVLDPFAGSGTTVEAAILEGFDVIGIEREGDYLPLIQARIFRAQATVDLAASLVPDQPDLFGEPA